MEEGVKEEFNYDEVLAYIGQFGKFQKKIFVWIWLVSGVTGLSVVTFGFTAYTPHYRVATECDSMNGSYDFDTERYSNTNDDISLELRNQDCRIPSVEKNDKGECVNVYFTNESIEINSSDINQLIFDRTIMRSTLVEEYQFVCDRSFIRPYISALFMLGMLFGSFLFGFLSDTFGRINTLMLAILWLSMAGFLGSFCMGTSGVIGFGVLRVLTGMGCSGSYIAAFVLGIEHVGYKFTMLMGIAVVIPFAIGEAVLGIEAYLIREWQILQIVAYLPIALLLVVYWCVPESVRWLVAHNKIDQAKSIIRKVAKENGRECPEHLLKHLTPTDDKPISTKTTKKTTIIDLFSTRLMLTRSLNMFFQWFSVTMCYYGLTSASTTSFAGDIYGNFFLSVLIEIPSYIFCIFLMDIWGRRPILSFCQIISGVSCIIIAFLEGSGLQGLEIFLSLLGKFGAAASFAIVYVYTAEMFPTVIRSQAVGTCSLVARIGGITALLLDLIKKFWEPAPVFIMGCTATVAGLLALLFPETLGETLPDTIEDAARIGKKNSRSLCQCTYISPFVLYKDELKDIPDNL